MTAPSKDLSCIHRAGCPKPKVCREVGHCTSMTESDLKRTPAQCIHGVEVERVNCNLCDQLHAEAQHVVKAPLSSNRKIPEFFGKLYPSDMPPEHSLLGTWVRRAEVDALLEEIERLRPAAESWESYVAAQERKGQPVETSELERLRGLISDLNDFVIDFDGHVPGDHALRLIKRAGLPVNAEAEAAVMKRAGLPVETSARSRPNDAVRWICSVCTTVNDNRDERCCVGSCKGRRPNPWPPVKAICDHRRGVDDEGCCQMCREPLCSTCGNEKDAHAALFCSNPFHLPENGMGNHGS